MARLREFDTDLALERAMNLFWRQGYNGTALQQLTEELGIGSGSLYAAFDSKEGLYARALERYCDSQPAALTLKLETAADIRAGLREALLNMAEEDLADPEKGCMLVNAATERSSHDGTVARVKSTFASVESALAGAIERAQARGELGAGHDPAELARFFTTFIQGLRVMGKARADRVFLESAVSGALKILD